MTVKLDRARSEVSRLFAVEGQFTERLQAKLCAAVAATASGSVGDDLLEAAGDDAALAGRLAAAAAKAVKLMAEAQSLRSAVEAARRARRAAIVAARQLEADELRQEAATVRTEAEKHGAKTQTLLRQLAEHEGTGFAPLPGRLTHTQGLLNRVAELEARAASLAARRVQTGGGVSVDGSLDDLLAALGAAPERMAPPLPEVLRWAREGIEAAARACAAKRHRPLSDEEAAALRLRFSVTWRNEEIDTARSSIVAVGEGAVRECVPSAS